MTVLPIHARVTIADGIEAYVTAVTIREGGYVVYEVAWWIDGELNATNDARMEIGFRN